MDLFWYLPYLFRFGDTHLRKSVQNPSSAVSVKKSHGSSDDAIEHIVMEFRGGVHANCDESPQAYESKRNQSAYQSRVNVYKIFSRQKPQIGFWKLEKLRKRSVLICWLFIVNVFNYLSLFCSAAFLKVYPEKQNKYFLRRHHRQIICFMV